MCVCFLVSDVANAVLRVYEFAYDVSSFSLLTTIPRLSNGGYGFIPGFSEKKTLIVDY
jgi:hypothetical protein